MRHEVGESTTNVVSFYGIYKHCKQLTSLDAYTYLNIGSGNEYNIKASLYSSADILSSKPGRAKDAKLDVLFNRKKKNDDGDWSQME